ncbi:MAG: endolytic transglycosylase MltG [Spirochaetia bacterium]
MKKLSAVLLLLLLLGGVAAWGYRSLFIPTDKATASGVPHIGVVFEVPRGTTLRSAASGLEELGLIPNAHALVLYSRFFGADGGIQAGVYAFDREQRPVDILDDLQRGNILDQSVAVTVPEGFTKQQIAARLDATGIVSANEFTKAANMSSAYRDFTFLEEVEDGVSLEGFLFPETYRLIPGTPGTDIVRSMLSVFAQRTGEELLSSIAAQNRSLREVLALASIVERESPPEDVHEIAGVFWNRIQRGMRLESDATVNYALGTSNLQPTFADTLIDHPYNTYRFVGLPPGPIGNPGLNSIAGAANPAEHDYLFFLHKPTRETVFSHTFTQHLAAKARYLD